MNYQNVYSGYVSEATSAAHEHYRRNIGLYTRLRDEVLYTLTSALNEAGIKTHSVAGRVKDEDSYLEKIDRKGYADPENEIEDLVGARVVCLFRSDLPRVQALIEANFRVHKREDKIEESGQDQFGYMSVHYISSLDPGHVGPRYHGLQEFRFEIQCRTILMDAWANVSHYLAYKGEASIPVGLRRDFHALAGLFYVADSHFEIFFRESMGVQQQAAEVVEQDLQALNIPLNRETLSAYLAQKYSARRPPTPGDTSDFVEEVVPLGYTTIELLNRQLTAVESEALAYESEFPPSGESDMFAAVGFARQALAVADARYARNKYPHEIAVFERYREAAK